MRQQALPARGIGSVSFVFARLSSKFGSPLFAPYSFFLIRGTFPCGEFEARAKVANGDVSVKKYNDNANFPGTASDTAIAWKSFKSKKLHVRKKCAIQRAKMRSVGRPMNRAGELDLREPPFGVVNPLV